MRGIFLLLLFTCKSLIAQIPIGQWRSHFNYQTAFQVIKGDKIYCATPTNLFSLDEEGEITEYSKTNGLNETGVSCIGWDELTQQLVIAYNNSNIDVLKQRSVKNISDIKLSLITGNKSIHHIYCNNGIAYLSSGLGIIAVDLIKYEIKETWIIGNNGAKSSVNCTVADNGYFYASTNDGLKKAPIQLFNLADYKNWQSIDQSIGLTDNGWGFCGILSNQLIAVKNDSVLLINKKGEIFYYDSTWKISSATISNNQLILIQNNASGAARVAIVQASGEVSAIAPASYIKDPSSALIYNNVIWVADKSKGLLQFTKEGNKPTSFMLNGPYGLMSGDFTISNSALYIASGGIDEVWNGRQNKAGIAMFLENQWTNINENSHQALRFVNDFISIAVDPTDESIWAGSFGNGLVQIIGTKTKLYNSTNSSLQNVQGNSTKCNVSGLVFDDQHNLWISNYGASTPLKVRKANGEWLSIPMPFVLTNNAVGQLLTDDYEQVWIVSPQNNGLICYQYGQDISNLNDDRWKMFRAGIGNGNLPSNNVLCIAKDKSNTIWVGTDNGIGIIQCSDNLFGNNGCEAILPVVQQNQYTGYLFKGEQIQCIAIDGADQKWIGTKNGVWLLNADGTKTLEHFTEANSRLINNDVKKIGIDPTSGEVFFATVSGLCSYRSTANFPNETMSNVLVFPNPIPANYGGIIGIKGLTNNALVKIVELNGRLVYQTRSSGGQATWNGKDYNGNKIASGIYLILVKDEAGKEHIATKIMITGGR